MSEKPQRPPVPATPIRVLVAHENDTVRSDIGALITRQSDMVVIAETSEGREVDALASVHGPDVVLLDLTMSGCGLGGLDRLAAAVPTAKVVILAMDVGNLASLRSVLAFGSLGWVVDALAHHELVAAVRKVVAGRAYVEVPTGGLPLDPQLDPTSPTHQGLRDQLGSLSRREREVLEAVAYGYTNREVADCLGVSVKSVETYRYRLADKLSFKRRADLVRFALASGVLRPGRGDPLAGCGRERREDG